MAYHEHNPMTNSKKPSLNALRGVGIQKHDAAPTASYLELDASAPTAGADADNAAEPAADAPSDLMADSTLMAHSTENLMEGPADTAHAPVAALPDTPADPPVAPLPDAEPFATPAASSYNTPPDDTLSNNTPSEVAHDAMQTGKGFLLIDRYEMALPFFQLALRAEPRNGEAWLESGACYKEMQQYEQAVDALMQATRLMPEHARAYQLLGESCHALRRWRQAMLAYRLCVELDPANGAAWNTLGLAHVEMGQYQDAFDAFTHAMQRLPGDPGVLTNLMDVSRKLGGQSA